MKDFFKPEDFQLDQARENKSVQLNASAALMANEKLNALIESWPVVYGHKAPGEHFIMSTDKEVVTLIYSARLAFIEEIVKEPCKHEPKRNYHYAQELAPTPICYHCGVELQATWSEKK